MNNVRLFALVVASIVTASCATMKEPLYDPPRLIGVLKENVKFPNHTFLKGSRYAVSETADGMKVLDLYSGTSMSGGVINAGGVLGFVPIPMGVSIAVEIGMDNCTTGSQVAWDNFYNKWAISSPGENGLDNFKPNHFCIDIEE